MMARRVARQHHSEENIRQFFANSELLDHFVTKPLSHFAPNWELSWEPHTQTYAKEDDSVASLLNHLIVDLSTQPRPVKYHDHEDTLAVRVQSELGWPILDVNGIWTENGKRILPEDYAIVLQQGGVMDWDQTDLLAAASGRLQAALDFNQQHFDDMENGHRNMLASLMAIILWVRWSPDGEDK